MRENDVLIIAEAGINHNGNLQTAKKMIEVAATSGADVVKFQTFSADRIVTRAAVKADYQLDHTSKEETQYEMLERFELSQSAHRELIDYCNVCRIGFLSTAFDIDSVDLLANLGQAMFKIPSGEITNLPYLRHIGQLGKPILISTGMSTLGEIEEAIEILRQEGALLESITVLHCTTEYPAPITEVNLRAMRSMAHAFGVRIGYSDHTLGLEVPIAAVALGARVIEKHFTLDRTSPGPDHAASLDPAQLEAMVSAIRNVEKALGDGVKRVTSSELKNREVARKSLVAKRAIQRNEFFTEENLTAKRPGTGISPMKWDEIIGRKSPRAFSTDELIEL